MKKQTLERCYKCDEVTDRAGKGEDSIYDDEENGPYCEHCYYDKLLEEDKLELSEYLDDKHNCS